MRSLCFIAISAFEVIEELTTGFTDECLHGADVCTEDIGNLLVGEQLFLFHPQDAQQIFRQGFQTMFQPYGILALFARGSNVFAR